MKKIWGLIVFVLAITAISTALADIPIDETNFPDPAFREYVKQFDKDGNDTLSKEEINNVETIDDLRDRGINNLTGIGHFSALKVLECPGIDLKQIDVSQNLMLVSLNCSFNSLTSLDVSQNLMLVSLNCSFNSLTSLDVSQNLMLENLYCNFNSLTSLDISKNSKLQYLICDYNKIEQIDISQNSELLNFSCSGNQLTELNVKENKKLTSLDCGGNPLNALDISCNVNLEALGCAVTNLKTLDISNNEILVNIVTTEDLFEDEDSGLVSYFLTSSDGYILQKLEFYKSTQLILHDQIYQYVAKGIQQIETENTITEETEQQEQQPSMPEIRAEESYGEKRWDANGVFLVPEKIIVPPSLQVARTCFMNNGRFVYTSIGSSFRYPLYESYQTDTKVVVSYDWRSPGSEVDSVKIYHSESNNSSSKRFETEHYYFYSWDIVYQQTSENVFEIDHIEITPQLKQGGGWSKIRLSTSLEILEMNNKDKTDYVSEIRGYDWSRLNLAVGDTLDLYPEGTAWEHGALFDELFSRSAGRYALGSESLNRNSQESNTIDGLYYYVREDGTSVITRYWVDEKQHTITIPEEVDGYPVVEIDADSIYGKNVTKVIIPNCVIDIGSNPFSGMEKLKEIVISPDHPNLEVINKVVYSKSDKRLICAPRAAKIGALIVPDGIEVIGDGAFWCNLSVSKVTIPGSVRIVGNQVFDGCQNLSKVTLSPGLQIIGDSAFNTCQKYGQVSKLTSIDLPDGLLYMGRTAFSSTRIKSMIIPDSVEIIGQQCFPDTLKEVKLPANLMYISEALFYGTQVQEIVIPDQVKRIDDRAFVNCKKLRKVIFPDALNFIGSDIFGGCYQLTEVNIPASVSFIHESAFTDGNTHFLDHESYIPSPVSKNLVITVVQGTYGEDFCRRMGISCK